MAFSKHQPSERAAAWEAAGLDWLRVPGGAAVVSVVGLHGRDLVLDRVVTSAPTVAAAEAFGRALTRTHAAGAGAFGVGPPLWSGPGFQGPVTDLLPLSLAPFQTWGAMYAAARVAPLVESARATFDQGQRAVFARLYDRLVAGDFDSGEPPARVHGDLWSGNLLWTSSDCVLIDPMAHASSREVDLAALALFGCPQLPRIVAAYDEAWPLADTWRERIPLMQLHLVLLHAVLFGGGYAGQAVAIARRYAG